jgi:di/tricarboxylate transporter
MLGFMVCSMFLSMWISNTACTAMMVPIVDAISEAISQSGEPGGRELEGGARAAAGGARSRAQEVGHPSTTCIQSGLCHCAVLCNIINRILL